MVSRGSSSLTCSVSANTPNIFSDISIFDHSFLCCYKTCCFKSAANMPARLYTPRFHRPGACAAEAPIQSANTGTRPDGAFLSIISVAYEQLYAVNDRTRVPEQGPCHGTLSLRGFLPRRLLAAKHHPPFCRIANCKSPVVRI